ncbi:MAG: hypothetical protein ABIE25_03030 [Thermoplasmatota archaeon]|nr:hypothetical protein [Candidatus Thermoplasmatota archaeon]MBU1914604.1 hypothetical protein [Candidatus Thermoplasmatota archaeon]
MEQDIRIETLIVMSVAIFLVMGVVAFIVPFEDTNTKLFFIGVVAALTTINVVGLFMVWRSSPTIVDEVFLMTPTGMLLKHYTRRLRPDQDQDIMAGMLTAVQNFVRESFDEAGGKLNEIKFENYDILISHSKNVVIAAIISTKKPERLRLQLKIATDDLEKEFGEKISHWSGDKKELGDVDLIMKKFLSGKYRH